MGEEGNSRRRRLKQDSSDEDGQSSTHSKNSEKCELPENAKRNKRKNHRTKMIIQRRNFRRQRKVTIILTLKRMNVGKARRAKRARTNTKRTPKLILGRRTKKAQDPAVARVAVQMWMENLKWRS